MHCSACAWEKVVLVFFFLSLLVCTELGGQLNCSSSYRARPRGLLIYLSLFLQCTRLCPVSFPLVSCLVSCLVTAVSCPASRLLSHLCLAAPVLPRDFSLVSFTCLVMCLVSILILLSTDVAAHPPRKSHPSSFSPLSLLSFPTPRTFAAHALTVSRTCCRR